MKALILAAGRGSRLGPLTEDRPKCLAQVGGRTLLDRQIAALRAGGVTQVGIVTGYRAELLDGVADRTFHNPRWSDTGIVASLLRAEAWLAAEPVVVSYGDIFYGAQIVRTLAGTRRPVVLAYDPDWLALWRQRFADPLADAESFVIDDESRLVDIGAPIGPGALPAGQCMGLFRLEPEGFAGLRSVLDALPRETAKTIDMTGLLRRALDARLPVFAVAQTGPWGEVDHPSDILLYERLHPGLST